MIAPVRTGWVSPCHVRQYRQSIELIRISNLETVPWLHYVPIKPSYDDLYDISAFFLGPLGADGQIDLSLGHPVSHIVAWTLYFVI